ncbi:MAG: LamG domain-containing protein, partial [Leptolyngbyaceae bacterium]|nr:LamG domain-containing protein [Leptolyngbyaceae bacterium]
MVGGASGPAAPTDPYFANVVSLLHFDTGDTTITDVKGNTWTAVGDAIANGTAKYGAYSLAVDGAGDVVTTPINDNFLFGSGDFTAEAWINPTVWDGVSSPGILGVWDDGSNTRQSWLIFKSTSQLRFLYNATNGSDVMAIIVNSPGIVAGQWHHIAVTRSGSTLYMFVDGVVKGTYNVGTNAFYAAQAGSVLSVGG